MCRPNWWSLLFLSFLIAVSGCTGKTPQPVTTQVVVDEAKMAGRDAASFPAADEDYYHDMDGAVPLTPSQVVGRNNWIVWTAGNDRFWDQLSS